MPTPHTILYHFTCTAALPWIVDAIGLRPYRNQIGGLPSPDLLWATTSSEVDPTAPGLEGYLKREGWDAWGDEVEKFSPQQTRTPEVINQQLAGARRA